jgi:hypothetical protein
MELGLKFMAIIGPDGMDPEREFGNHIIDKIYGILLGMAGINFQGSDSSGIIYGRILKTTDGLSMGPLELQKLYIHLDMMPGYLLFIALGLYGSCFGISGEPIQAISLENLVDAAGGDL